MKIFYYDECANFGDSLNGWLWPRIFEGLQLPEDVLMVGIGTILDGRIPKDGKKIIFGSGFRPSKNKASVDDSWEFSFVRGPRSSAALNNVPWIADSAYCLRFLDLPAPPKRYKLSYVSHYMSEIGGISIKNIVEKHGIKFIDSRDPVESVLNDIRMSEKVLSEAMHGVIVADAYRIPWRRVKYRAHIHEKPEVSEFKWADWAEALETTPEVTTVSPAWNDGSILQRFANHFKNADADKKFRNAHNLRYQLSPTEVLNQRLDQLREAVEEMRNRSVKPAYGTY